MQLAGSHAVANKPAEAALCLESRASIYLDARLRSEHAGFGENVLRTKQAHTDPRPFGENVLRTKQAHTDPRPTPA